MVNVRHATIGSLVLFATACSVGGPIDAGTGDGGDLPIDAGACPRCEGDDAISCDGTRATCEGACAAGVCVACRPGSLFCEGTTELRRCSPDGSASELVETCAAPELCDGGACYDPCAPDPDNAQPSFGCSFVAVPTLNSALGGSERQFMNGRTLGADGFSFAVALANPHTYPVHAEISGAGVSIARDIEPGAIATIELPWILPITQPYPAGVPTVGPFGPYRPTPSVHASDATYRVRTNAPVVAYQFNPLRYYDDDPTHTLCGEVGESPSCFSYTNDASLLLPEPALGRRYTVVAFGSRYVEETCGPTFGVAENYGAYVAIVGVSDEPTEVTVQPSAWVRPGPDIAARVGPGGEIVRTLARGDVLQLSADRPTEAECGAVTGPLCAAPCRYDGDLSGTIVLADRAVAVFAGHDCAQVPAGVIACDHLEDQLWPDEALGQSYVLTPLYPPSGGGRTPTIGRIVATADDTTVELSPPATASAAISVAQFLVGDQLTELSSDPSMVVSIPQEQWRVEYPILVPDTYPESFLTIAAPIGETVSLDGDELGDAYERTERFAFYYVAITPGAHTLSGSAPFTALVSGHGPFVSYAYPAGGNLEIINVI
jgi:hypothetical protein